MTEQEKRSGWIFTMTLAVVTAFGTGVMTNQLAPDLLSCYKADWELSAFSEDKTENRTLELMPWIASAADPVQVTLTSFHGYDATIRYGVNRDAKGKQWETAVLHPGSKLLLTAYAITLTVPANMVRIGETTYDVTTGEPVKLTDRSSKLETETCGRIDYGAAGY